MQITRFTPYALRMILRENLRGIQVAGYTLRPSTRLEGLFAYAKDMPRGKYVGFHG